ncbi:MAG: tetratricopeptide repeat protein [Rhodospirillaceae bacterium]|nr:tetratricopeptide repeat protein [Rhodospirillaceae bacterium]MDD9918565.1 tetratricopeptide repeat protein [Rhodospirillaceae bacterium]MDD9925989.1 tetratricopeptide repeat protein [Rhodospirillaceae bacterium]
MSHQDRLRNALAAGDLASAERHAMAALREDPSDGMLLARLGSIRMGLGRGDEGVDALRRATEALPQAGVVWNEYGVALATTGATREAETALRKALSLAPDIPQIHNNYGNVLRGRAAYREAIACYQAALDRRPDYLEARGNMGVALQEAGDSAAAIECFESVLENAPEDGATWTHLGAALATEGRLVDAEAAHRKAIALLPGSPDPHNNLGIVLKDQGRLVEARDAYQAALERDPADSGLHSNLLMCLCYDPAVTAEETIELHRDWAARYAPLADVEPFHIDDKGPLRVGYLSPDFREHSVAYFVDSIFANHNSACVSLYAYNDAADSDETTARLRASTAHWRDVYTDDTETLYRRIRDDGIQVLIDLAGHTANNRLPVFARRAAPVQVTWLGYGMTTGLPQMDYLLSDDWVDPPGPADDWCTEEICRLPSGFMCYTPPRDTPLPEPKTGRPLTFGSFNNLSKVNEDVVALWARLLQAVPDSELLLKSRQLADPSICDRLRSQFAASGIAPNRIRFTGRTASRAEHYALYGAVDVALDTFPYNGATTTCEALWMGTPVVALTGDRHVGRFGLTFLTRAGFPEWVGDTPDAFVSIAAALARDRPDAETVRRTVAGSLLVDGAAAARDLETAYARMWQRWKEAADG